MKQTLAALLFVLPAIALADPGCTVKDANGTYAFMANGNLLVPGTPITGPFSRIGYFVLDGKGSVHTTTLALYNGLNFGVEDFGGTYSVTSDCAITFDELIPAPVFSNAEFKGQLAQGGDSITFMLTHTDNPQAPAITTVAGFGERRSGRVNGEGQANKCSAADLAGKWRMEINGYLNVAPFQVGTQFRQVGAFNLDGHGSLLATFITSNNGAMSQDTGAGTYRVNSDCTFDLTYTIGSTPYGIRGSISDEQHAFIALNMPPIQGPVTGAVATGTMLRQ